MKIVVKSPKVKYTPEYIESSYDYNTNAVKESKELCEITPITTRILIRTHKIVPKVGLMLVGWGGNNGTTLTGAILANKNEMNWNTKEGLKFANYFGSITQASTISVGLNKNKEIFAPMKDILPLIDPNDIIVDGWDISSLNMADAMVRAKVFDYNLQEKLIPLMKNMKPRPSIYIPHFIAANQEERADNILKGSFIEQINAIRSDIKDFKTSYNLKKVIILWTANTECFSEIKPGTNVTIDELEKSISINSPNLSPSTLFAYASIMEGCSFINGSPQNTFVPGLIELSKIKNVFIAGDDFKSGQTKIKSVLVDFLVTAGIKPLSIVSYNHLGNNDGYNLSAPAQFRSKEISKSSVVDDMVTSNGILYGPNEKPDHCIVIKYVPTVGDSKRAMDEYVSELMMGGTNTIAIHNTCEDSLLAAPIILDLVILTELCQRVTFKVGTDANTPWQTFHPVLSILSYLCKAPLVPDGTPVVNALFRQKACVDNFFRACVGLGPEHHMLLEYKVPGLESHNHQQLQQQQQVPANKSIGGDVGPAKKPIVVPLQYENEDIVVANGGY